MTSIPKMTHPLGKYWEQPPLEKIDVHDNIALMHARTFAMLNIYNWTLPTGAYEGKMWKRKEGRRWFLVWYDNHPTNPKLLSIKARRIVLE